MDNRYLFADIWRQIFVWFDMIIQSFSDLSNFITSPLKDLIALLDNQLLVDAFTGIVQVLGISDFTMLEFMFGSLLPFVLLVAFVKFFLDLF